MWLSGHGEMDHVAKTRKEFYLAREKYFMYYDNLKILQSNPKFSGGAEQTRSGALKRTKFSASENYSTFDGGLTIDLNVTNDDVFGSFPSIQSHPMGTRAAKGKAKGKAATSYPTMLA